MYIFILGLSNYFLLYLLVIFFYSLMYKRYVSVLYWEKFLNFSNVRFRLDRNFTDKGDNFFNSQKQIISFSPISLY